MKIPIQNRLLCRQNTLVERAFCQQKPLVCKKGLIFIIFSILYKKFNKYDDLHLIDENTNRNSAIFRKKLFLENVVKNTIIGRHFLSAETPRL